MGMKKNKRNVVSILLTLCMLLSGLTAFADNTDVTLYQYSQSEEAIQEFEKQKPELLEAYKQDFPTESGWWDEYAIMPIVTGVISGYPDGTLKPNNPVTGGEFAKMVATSFFTDISSGGTVDNEEWAGKWYNNYYNAVAKAFPYFNSQFAPVEFMESPMKRSEVAYVLAKIIDSSSLDKYIEAVENGDLSTMSDYTDFAQYVYTGENLTNKDISKSTMFHSEWNWESANELRTTYNIIPNNQVAAIMMLKDLGIMVGDGAGHISPNGNVTRAEVFKLLGESCKATKENIDLNFFGWENSGLDFITEEDIKNLSWKYEMETILNPEAEKEQQYTLGDLDWGNLSGIPLNPYVIKALVETEEGVEILNKYLDSLVNEYVDINSASEEEIDVINAVRVTFLKPIDESYIKSHYTMSGMHNIKLNSELWQIPLGKEFEAKLLNEVVNSVTLENDTIKVYIPSFKSKYHEIYVSYSSDNIEYHTILTSTLNEGWNEIKFDKDALVRNTLTITTRGKTYGATAFSNNPIYVDYIYNTIADGTTDTVKEISR